MFSIFSYGLFKRKRIVFFIVLFFIELLNRESALFIALWLIIDSIDLQSERSRISLYVRDKLAMVIGVGLSFFSVIVTKVVRDALFIRSSLDSIGLDTGHAAIGNHNQLIVNVKAFKDNIIPNPNINILVNVFILYFIYIICTNFKLFSHYQRKILILVSIIFISTFLFGLINETRVWFVFIPFILMYKISLSSTSPTR